MLTPWKQSYDQARQQSKKQQHYFANKGPCSQSYVFSSSHIWMWELDYKESWVPKNWWFWIVVLEKTLESPLGCKIKPVNPKGNQSWIFIGRTDAEAEATNNTLAVWCEAPTHWKRPWCWERLRTGRERGDRGWDGWVASLTRWTWVWANSKRRERQGSVARCSPWVWKEPDMLRGWLTAPSPLSTSPLSMSVSLFLPCR